jgi:hypothetical protein
VVAFLLLESYYVAIISPFYQGPASHPHYGCNTASLETALLAHHVLVYKAEVPYSGVSFLILLAGMPLAVICFRL